LSVDEIEIVDEVERESSKCRGLYRSLLGWISCGMG